MSKSFQPDSIHPYIMDARLKKATGTGGIVNIPIASSDTVGGIMIGGSANPITITGSGNASIRKATSELLGVIKAGDGVTIDANGAISGVAYSTTAEHKTGRKWIDGKDIYEKVIEYTGALGNDPVTLASDINYMSNIINALCISDGVEGSYTCSVSPITVWIDGTNLKGRSLGNFTSQALHIIIEYTKKATQE